MAPPVNDDYAYWTDLDPTGSHPAGSLAGQTTVDATFQVDELSIGGIGQTVWYGIGALPGVLAMRFDTDAFNDLAFYEEAADLASLVYLASSPDPGHPVGSVVTPGDVYVLQVDAHDTAGPFTVTWESWTAPANDNFADAMDLGDALDGAIDGSHASSLFGATGEVDEQWPVAGSPQNSVWYKWTCPHGAGLGADVDWFTVAKDFGENFIDTVLALYTGTSLADLVEVAHDAGSGGGGANSFLSMHADSDTVYWIQVFGLSGAEAPLELGWSATLTPPPPQWSLVITDRDGTPVHTFTSDDAVADGPIVAFEGQDTANDIGAGHLTLPAEDAANDYLDEDRLIHLYVRGNYVTSYIVRVPMVGVVEPGEEGTEMAVWELAHLLGVTEEGIVEPPGGMDFQPAAADRSFNFASPELDDSGWIASTELGTFAGPFGTIPVLPPAWPPGSAAVPIWSRDYDTSGGHYNMPVGTSYFRDTFTLGGSDDRQCRVFNVADDNVEVWLDGVLLQSRIGVEPPTMLTSQDVKLSPGDHTVAFKVTNIDRPGNPDNIAYLFLAVWTMLDGSDATDTELVASSASTLCVDYPATPPGFNAGEIILQTLSEEQALSALVDVVCSFDATNDSAGNPWNDPVDVSTKSLSGLEQFWVKELTGTLADIDAHYDFGASNVVIDAWNKDSHHPASGLTLTEGVNLAEFAMPHAARVMSSAAVSWNDGGFLSFHTVDSAAPSGKPVKRRGLSLGALHSLDDVEREAASQVDVFNRQRNAPTLLHAINNVTADADLPPNYWKWSQLDIAVDSRWLESGTVTLVAVSFALTSDGLVAFIPEVGDLIIPPGAQPAVTLRKMTAANLSGQSRVASPWTAG